MNECLWRDEETLLKLYDEFRTYKGVAEELGCSRQTAAKWCEKFNVRQKTLHDYTDVAMFSGGHDSLVMTHYCMENDITDVVLHIDTGTGLDENLQFVKDVCDKYDWPLEVYSSNISFEEFVMEYGFPSAAAHSWAYRLLKERAISSFATDCNYTPTFYSGIYQDESSRRMRNISGEYYEPKHGHWVWSAPLYDWEETQFKEYMEEYNLPENPVVKHIHRSGECFCGAFGNRDEELVVLQAEYPDHADWILELEKSVQEENGTDEYYCWWGGEGGCNHIPDHERSDMMMCQDCVSGDTDE